MIYCKNLFFYFLFILFICWFFSFYLCEKNSCYHFYQNYKENDFFQYTNTVLHTNADGTVSIIHVDPNNPIITLPDGTTAQVQGIATVILALKMGNSFLW